MPDLLSRKTVARTFGVTEPTIRRWAADGYLTEVQVGPRTVRITADSVQRHLKRIGAIHPASAA